MELKYHEEEQVQRTAIMVDLDLSIDGFYLSMLIQFTYVSLYHGILPLSSLFLFLSNLAVIFITERMYSYITKRSLSKQIKDIGIWNDVFEAVGLLCIIGSAFITTYTTQSLDRYFSGNKELALLVIIAAEHFVLGLRFLMSKIISSVPGWLRKQINYRESMISQEALNKSINDSKTDSTSKSGGDSFFGIMAVKPKKAEEQKNKPQSTQMRQTSSTPVGPQAQTQVKPVAQTQVKPITQTEIKPLTPVQTEPDQLTIEKPIQPDIKITVVQYEPEKNIVSPEDARDRVNDSIADIPIIKSNYTKVTWPDNKQSSIYLRELEIRLSKNILNIDQTQQEKYLYELSANPGFYSKQSKMIKEASLNSNKQFEQAAEEIKKTTLQFQAQLDAETSQVQNEIRSLKLKANSDPAVDFDDILLLEEKLEELELSKTQFHEKLNAEMSEINMQKTVIGMAKSFAGVFHQLMSKAFLELDKFISSNETPKFDQISQLQSSQNPVNDQLAAEISQQIKMDRISLFEILKEHKKVAKQLATNAATSTSDMKTLTSEGLALWNSKVLPDLDIDLLSFFRDYAGFQPLTGSVKQQIQMSGVDREYSVEGENDRFDPDDDADSEDPFAKQAEKAKKKFQNEDDQFLNDIMQGKEGKYRRHNEGGKEFLVDEDHNECVV